MPLRVYGVTIADGDARSLVATLVADGRTDAIAAAAKLTAGLEHPPGRIGLVGLEPHQRHAVLRCLEDSPNRSLIMLRRALADEQASHPSSL